MARIRIATLIALLPLCSGISAGPARAASPLVALPPGTHKLMFSTLDQGNGGTALLPGYNTVDSTRVSCPFAAGCTVEFEVMVEAGKQSVARNRWSICGYVDSVAANPGCPFQGELPADTSFATGNVRQVMQVKPGSHAVSFAVYVIAGASLASWQADYRVYTP